jgi:hypothetical protein
LRSVALLAALLISGEGIGAERELNAKGGSSRPSKTSAHPRAAGRSDQAERLFGISWFNSLKAAGKAAGCGKPLDQGRPIFCFRVLGKLAGFM